MRHSRGPSKHLSGNERSKNPAPGLHKKAFDGQHRDSGLKRARHGHANLRNQNGQGPPREDSFPYNGGRNFGSGAWSRTQDDS